MARTVVNTVRVIPGLTPAEAAESSVAVDAGNGMKIVPQLKTRGIAIRITNTHSSGHAVTVKASQSAGNNAVSTVRPGQAAPPPASPTT